MKRVYLKPHSTYRTVLHSDTLFGCVCWAIREVFSEAKLEELLAQFASGNPPFQISSAFPFRDNESDGRTHFYPRPMLMPTQFEIPKDVDEAEKQKRFRKAKWITEETLSKFASGVWNETDYYASNTWDAEGPEEMTLEVQHNTIDRLSGGTTPSGNLYSLTEYAISDGGLFFLMDGEADVVEGAFGFLEHFGIGGDSSLGKGQFEIEVIDADLPAAPEGADRFMTLSLYAPREAEMATVRSDGAWYNLVVRKGKVGGPFLRVDDFWKKSLTMFAEGSTFPMSQQKPFGHNPIVKGIADGLPFDVQHYGYAFQIPIKTKAA